MKYMIEMFDAENDELVDEVEVPTDRKQELFVLMGWENPEDEVHVYDVSEAQLEVFERWMGRKIGASGRIVQLAVFAD